MFADVVILPGEIRFLVTDGINKFQQMATETKNIIPQYLNLVQGNKTCSNRHVDFEAKS